MKYHTSSPPAIEHMKNVMRGVTKSRRHAMFLERSQRDHCSGARMSTLHKISNPGYLGGGGEKDTAVITHIRDRVFLQYFKMADPNLRELGIGIAYLYVTSVLFPETFIHQQQVWGKQA